MLLLREGPERRTVRRGVGQIHDKLLSHLDGVLSKALGAVFELHILLKS